MESLTSEEAVRVLSAAAALDAVRVPPGRPPGDQPAAPALSENDVWIGMSETEDAQQQRRGDLDSWLDVFSATASSVRNAWRHVEGLTFESLAFGWLALARKHEAVPCSPEGDEFEDMSVLLRWQDEARWGLAAYYATTQESLLEYLGLPATDLLAFCAATSGWRPAFFAGLDHNSRTVRVVVRGTGHMRDLLTSLAGHSSPFGAGHVHHGMHEAAQQLLAEESDRLRDALAAHPSYGLLFIGHSLGAGTAAVLAILAAGGGPCAQALGSPSVRATCFASPPVVTAQVAAECIGYVECVVYNADLVSRCSVLSLRRLSEELTGASEEVLAKSELAAAMSRSGALGLATHLVAAALCRSQPSQEPAVGTRGPPAAGGARPAVMEGLTLLGGALGRVAVAALAPPAQPNGRLAQLTTLGSQLRTAAGAAATAAAAELQSAASASAASSGFAGAGAPQGPPSGTLPPVMLHSTGAAASGARGTGHTSPLRRATDPHGVLDPPPLVAAAAAATAQTASATSGPTPPRRGLLGFLGDLGTMVGQQNGPATSAMLSAMTAAAAAAATAVLLPYGTVSAPAAADDLGPGPHRAAPSDNGTPAGIVLAPLPGPVQRQGLRRDSTTYSEQLAVPAGHAPLPPLLPLPSTSSCPALPPHVGLAQLPLPPSSGLAHAGPPLLPGLKRASVDALTVASEQQAPDDPSGAEEVSSAASHEFHELCLPGRVFMIERRGADATASFRLLRNVSRLPLNRMLLKRSMLRDHLLSHYVAAMERMTQSPPQPGPSSDAAAAPNGAAV